MPMGLGAQCNEADCLQSHVIRNWWATGGSERCRSVSSRRPKGRAFNACNDSTFTYVQTYADYVVSMQNFLGGMWHTSLYPTL
ncbi:unnamed protein product [Ceratitis capitata]|uniref:(Mediterranean fruit fly) hypothetical protein n=1 Tax=Ceratitis capitata TaxID=7213 RepID=A0A811VAG0_CERCA|nr:unnamed protein product [Ceratitis capitata]